jgi:tetratricopeptide (TPR) repeat protein
MAALALIKRAEALRAELHYRLSSVSSQDLETVIGQAKTSYTQAIEKAPTSPSLVAAAKFGLGLCEEELGEFEKAAQIYREVTENPDFQATVANAAAKRRLETMDDYKQKLAFKPAPIPTTPLMPLVEKLTTDINLPVDVNQGPQSSNSVSTVPDTNMGSQSP